MNFLRCVLGLILLLLAGCGPKDPTRYHLSGEVTFDGKPLKSGMIQITPDYSQQEDGLMGVIGIVDGKFDSKAHGIGHSGGPVILLVYGNHDAPYEMKVDLPKGDHVLKIEVPSAAGT